MLKQLHRVAAESVRLVQNMWQLLCISRISEIAGFGSGSVGVGWGLFREENTCLLLQHFILFFCCSIEGNVLLITFHPRHAHKVQTFVQIAKIDKILIILLMASMTTMTTARFCSTMCLRSLGNALLLLTIYHLRLRY